MADRGSIAQGRIDEANRQQLDQIQQDLGGSNMNGNQRTKADSVPEIFFMGQIVGGQDFPCSDDGLFIEAQLIYGDDWEFFEKSNKRNMQTHTAYPDEEGFYIFAHPFDFHFRPKSVQGWPKLQLKVWRLDQWDKLDTIAYGIVNLPNETGAFDLECPTWRPMTGWKEESYNFYLGGPPKLMNSDPIGKDPKQRTILTTMSSGTVIIHVEVMMKAFAEQNITGEK